MDARAWTHVLYGLAALGVLWFALRPRAAVGRIGTGTIGRESAPLLTLPSMTAQPIVTASTLAFLREREALRLTPYRDGPGYSIGYGHFLGTASPGALRISVAQAEQWLYTDAEKAASAVKRLVRIPLSQNQFDALVSFVYNVGESDFRNSTLLRLLNSGDVVNAAEQFRRWVYQGQTVLTGLVTRRIKEKELFLS